MVNEYSCAVLVSDCGPVVVYAIDIVEDSGEWRGKK